MLLFIVGFIIFLYKNRNDERDNIDILFSWFLLLIVGLAFSLAIALGIRAIDSNKIEYYKKTCNIYSLKSSSEINGKFILGSGTIEQEEYYYYYYMTSNGYSRGKREVRFSYIVEDSSTKPHVEQLYEKYSSKSGLFKFPDSEKTKYKIIVPKGTIVSTFKLN